MSDLLAADFARLLKSQVFHGIMIFCVECLTFEVIVGYINKELNQAYIYSLMNTNFILFGILLSVFIGLFIGSEYSDGTIRNKLVAGNSRAAVYFSNFVISVIAGFIMQAVFFILPRIFLLIIYGTAKDPYIANSLSTLSFIAQSQLIGLYIVIAYTAIFVFIAMMISSKSGAAAAVMATALVMFALGMASHNLVYSYDPKTAEAEAAEAVQENTDEWADDEYQSLLYKLNNRRNKKLSGPALKALLFLDDFLPSAQTQGIAGKDVTFKKFSEKAPKYAVYDLSITAAATALGMILYSRKDLK